MSDISKANAEVEKAVRIGKGLGLQKEEDNELEKTLDNWLADHRGVKKSNVENKYDGDAFEAENEIMESEDGEVTELQYMLAKELMSNNNDDANK